MEKEVKEGLASSGEAQKFLKTSRTTLWRAGQAGALTQIKFGRAVRYRWEDLERLSREGLPSFRGAEKGGV
ncbi:MAG: DNA-binding protein [Betaproteobacteria bacterium]|nr:DNA-binding protein [Betaproteobacteria bacterium]